MKQLLSLLGFVLAITSALAAAPPKRSFTGIVTDSVCGKDGHSQMRMGPTDAECARACVAAHGAMYVLNDGKDVYILSDQKTSEAFAGQRVKAIGILDGKTKTLQVESMVATH